MTVREQAALICQIAASTPGDLRPYYLDIAEWIDAPREAATLAIDAWDEAFSLPPWIWTAETDAEAEAMLRTGWTKNKPDIESP